MANMNDTRLAVGDADVLSSLSVAAGRTREEIRALYGARLEAWREQRKFSRRELGERVGAHGQSVYNWERGVSAPDVDVAALILDVLGLDWARFFSKTPNEIEEEAMAQREHGQDLLEPPNGTAKK